MGHLRYSTTGKSGISYVHPFLRRNNWRAKNLALCGNFNLTNVQDIFEEITAIGQHPRAYADTFIMLEQVGHRLDREVERLYRKYEAEGLKGMNSPQRRGKCRPVECPETLCPAVGRWFRLICGLHREW